MASPCSSPSSGCRLVLAAADVVAALLLCTAAVVSATDGGCDPTVGFTKTELRGGGFTILRGPRSGVTVVQIHNKKGRIPTTTMMLHLYNGTMRWYNGVVVERDVYDRWVQVNVVHDVVASKVAVYVNREPRLAITAVRSKSHYFKFGIYMQHHDVSTRMEVRWKDVSIYTKPY